MIAAFLASASSSRASGVGWNVALLSGKDTDTPDLIGVPKLPASSAASALCALTRNARERARRTGFRMGQDSNQKNR